VARVGELQEGEHHPAARLQHALGLLQIKVRVLVQEMREDGEETHHILGGEFEAIGG